MKGFLIDNRLMPWYLILLVIGVSEVFIISINSILSLVWRGRISTDLIYIGAVDAMVVSAGLGVMIFFFFNSSGKKTDTDQPTGQKAGMGTGVGGLANGPDKSLQDIIDTFPDPMMIINRDYRIEMANHFIREKNRDEKDITNFKCHEISHLRDTPCEGEGHPCPLREVVRTRGHVSVEHIYPDEDGKDHIIEISATPVFDKDGDVELVIESFRDITHRIDIEKKLRESEETYRRILETVPDAITITCMTDGRYLMVNDYFCKTTGYQRDEVIGRTPFDLQLFVDSEDRQRLVNLLKKDGEVNNLDIRYQAKNGDILETLISARPLTYGGNECLVSVATDITQRKRMEEARVMLSAALEQSPEIIYVTDPGGKIM